MKEVDILATKARVEDRCINVSALARKYELNINSTNRYLSGKLDGKSGQGVYGQIEAALEKEDLLVFEPAA